MAIVCYCLATHCMAGVIFFPVLPTVLWMDFAHLCSEGRTGLSRWAVSACWSRHRVKDSGNWESEKDWALDRAQCIRTDECRIVVKTLIRLFRTVHKWDQDVSFPREKERSSILSHWPTHLHRHYAHHAAFILLPQRVCAYEERCVWRSGDRMVCGSVLERDVSSLLVSWNTGIYAFMSV